jgi:hypothetical protein
VTLEREKPFFLLMSLDIIGHTCGCMLDGDVMFKDLSYECGGYQFGLEYETMCWI